MLIRNIRKYAKLNQNTDGKKSGTEKVVHLA